MVRLQAILNNRTCILSSLCSNTQQLQYLLQANVKELVNSHHLPTNTSWVSHNLASLSSNLASPNHLERTAK